MNPGQDDMGGHLADDMGIVGDAGGTGISGPAIGLGSGAGARLVARKAWRLSSRVIGHLAQADATGAEAAIFYLNSADDQHFALMAAPAAAGDRIVFAAASDFGFVNLD